MALPARVACAPRQTPPDRDGDVGRAAADIDHHGPARLVDRQPGAERGGDRLLDQIHLAGAGRHRGLVDRAPLDGRSAGRHADQDARAKEAEHRLRAPDELAQHLLGRHEIGDDAVAQRADVSMLSGVRPSIGLAFRPTARTSRTPPRERMATTEGSSMMTPRPAT